MTVPSPPCNRLTPKHVSHTCCPVARQPPVLPPTPVATQAHRHPSGPLDRRVHPHLRESLGDGDIAGCLEAEGLKRKFKTDAFMYRFR